MTAADFLAACAVLVGDGRGMLRRVRRMFGFSESTLRAIEAGRRPVPERYAAAVREAVAEADRAGGCVRVVAPALERVMHDAEAVGCDERAACAAIAAWAALRLAHSR